MMYSSKHPWWLAGGAVFVEKSSMSPHKITHISMYGQVRARLSQLEATLAALNADFEKAESENFEAQSTYEQSKNKIGLARRLLSSLGGETERWAQGMQTLLGEKECLVGDVLIASAFLSYMGPFTKRFRIQLMREYLLPLMTTCINDGHMVISPATDPLRVLTNEAEIATWNIQGLPADPVSAENGAIVDKCVRWPLIIDPQLQVSKPPNHENIDEKRNITCLLLPQHTA